MELENIESGNNYFKASDQYNSQKRQNLVWIHAHKVK